MAKKSVGTCVVRRYCGPSNSLRRSPKSRGALETQERMQMCHTDRGRKRGSLECDFFLASQDEACYLATSRFSKRIIMISSGGDARVKGLHAVDFRSALKVQPNLDGTCSESPLDIRLSWQ